MKIAIDTNLLVRAIINDIPEQAAKARNLISEKCTSANPGFISLIVCTELDFVLRKKIKYDRSYLFDIFTNLLHSEELEVEDPILLSSILYQYVNTGADLADLLISKIGENHGCNTTYTFDRKAAKQEGFTLLK